jgi:hypothetical protein
MLSTKELYKKPDLTKTLKSFKYMYIFPWEEHGLLKCRKLIIHHQKHFVLFL